jgi:hypothetical protein
VLPPPPHPDPKPPLPEPEPPVVPEVPIVLPPTPPVVEPPVVIEPELPPEPEPEPEPEIVPVEPEPVDEEPELEEEQLEPPLEETTEEEMVTLDNGVVLTQEQAAAVALLQDPGALLEAIFTDPAAAFAALGQVGADMTDEVREKSEKVIISAVLAGNIATTAAAGAATYRRKI